MSHSDGLIMKLMLELIGIARFFWRLGLGNWRLRLIGAGSIRI
tara:strand:- start:1 stop:129 length:129 start_codon:yes stop_codon:yes gene_type:complete